MGFCASVSLSIEPFLSTQICSFCCKRRVKLVTIYCVGEFSGHCSAFCNSLFIGFQFISLRFVFISLKIKHKQTLQELRQLQQENSSLEIKIRELSSSHNEMIQLRKDVQKLQQNNEMNFSRVNQLEGENEALRARLRNVVQSPLSDNEKQQMLQESQNRMHSSAPASIALPNVSSIFPVLLHFFINFAIYCSTQPITMILRHVRHRIGTNSLQAAKCLWLVCKIK